MKKIICVVLLIGFAPTVWQAEIPILPKNVIIMIGDGMGFNQVEAGSLFRYGRPKGQIYWSFTQLASSTYSLSTPGGYNPAIAYTDFDYFAKNPTDSAAAATALSTGQKTKNKMLGLGSDGQSLQHLMEDAEALGKATGVLSTVFFAHATPAGFIVHAASRDNYEVIARQMLWESAADVILACGHPWYDEDGVQVGGFAPDPFQTTLKYDRVGGEESWKKVLKGEPGADADGDGQGDPWTLVDTRKGIRQLASSDTVPKRLLGVVPVYGTLQFERSGNPYAPPYQEKQIATSPTMTELVAAALNVLRRDEDGFVLMAEGGAIDWACHENMSGRLIEEQIDFDRAVEFVVDWVEKYSNWDETLLIVTADHECGYLTGPGSDPTWRPLINNGAGTLPGMEWHAGDHTNQLVPFFVKGVGENEYYQKARNNDPQKGLYLDNTDIPDTVRELWRKNQPEPLKPEPLKIVVKPYLQMATKQSIRVLWETSIPARSSVLFGEAQFDSEEAKLTQRVENTDFRTMHELELKGLSPETDYFYQTVSMDEKGEKIESDVYSFKTAVREDSAYAFTVFSDTQTNPPIWGAIAEKAWRERPNFALHAGDIVGSGDNKQQWVDDFLKPGHVFMSRIPIYAILGNHDKNHAFYYQYIANPDPEYYYTFHYGNAQFFLVDSNRDMMPGSEIFGWLDGELGKSKSLWKFVVHHHPPYSSDENDYGDTYKEKSRLGDRRVQPLISLYEKYGVDMVFYGHIHDYERTWPVRENRVNPQDGVIYIQTGGCGGSLEDYAPSRSWFTAKVKRDHHFCLVAIHDKRLEFQAIDLNGNVFDDFTVDKQ